jgi:hypothetical protein
MPMKNLNCLQGFPAGKLHGFQRNPIKNHDFHIFGVFFHIFSTVRSVRTRIATLSRVSSGPWRLDVGVLGFGRFFSIASNNNNDNNNNNKTKQQINKSTTNQHMKRYEKI